MVDHPREGQEKLRYQTRRDWLGCSGRHFVFAGNGRDERLECALDVTAIVIDPVSAWRNRIRSVDLECKRKTIHRSDPDYGRIGNVRKQSGRVG